MGVLGSEKPSDDVSFEFKGSRLQEHFLWILGCKSGSVVEILHKSLVLKTEDSCGGFISFITMSWVARMCSGIRETNGPFPNVFAKSITKLSQKARVVQISAAILLKMFFYYFWEYNLIISFLPSLCTLQSLPHNPLYFLSSSWFFFHCFCMQICLCVHILLMSLFRSCLSNHVDQALWVCSFWHCWETLSHRKIPDPLALMTFLS